MKLIYSLIIVLLSIVTNAQYITISELSVLNNTVKETSGLIYYNDKVITHNDSGNSPFLYEIDTTNGEILRTIVIENATNADWEDLAQDSSYIYVADIGNNSGDRTNLKIYRINKIDYLANNFVTADTISFTYNNQTDFTSNYRNTEFDAEALSVFNDSLIIFMKDWVNNSTRTYVLPKTPGNYIAFERDTFNCNGLITGSDYNSTTNTFMLSGYTGTLAPFIVHISNPNPNDVFSGTINKIDLTDSIGASQTEGICFTQNNKFFLSREEFTYQSIVLEPKLYSLVYDSVSNKINNIYKPKILLSPNPAHNYIKINSGLTQIESAKIFDAFGNQIDVNTQAEIIDISTLNNGIYFLHIEINNKIQIIKFVKNQ